ncbi:hypothetical protein K1719_044232 [Acacia pycnantha]|nr:hypothetical protein K1719_044232 [Acacia pycnantha]
MLLWSFRLVFLSLAGCERLASLPRLPPRLIRLEVDGCYSMKRKDRTTKTTYYVRGESSSTSNTLNSPPEWKYDVFLSFAGKDTRLNLTGHLYDAFSRCGIRCFRDDVDLEKGEDINYLFQAIEDSLCAVVVISKNYAKSTWCLDELQKILESREKWGQRIFPIFCNVYPADVRHQQESFGEAFAKLEKKFKENTTKVQNWRTALSKLATCLAGSPGTSMRQILLVYNSTRIPNSRLRKFEEIKEVLENNKGSREIEAIVMEDWHEDEDVIEQHKAILEWHKAHVSLEVYQLEPFSQFHETPDFSNVQCLEHLRLSSCTSLVKVHESLGVLKKLVEVDLRDCGNLNNLPSKLETNSLRKLDLGGCKMLKATEFGEGMKKLSYLDASFTAITSLPNHLDP